MLHNIEIKIECKGKAVGTLGWFNSIMEKSEFVIKESKSGVPAIFLKTKKKDGENYDFRFLCKKRGAQEEIFGYQLTEDDYLLEIIESNPYADGLFNFPLTPACTKAVGEMIVKAKQIFAEWWENN